MSRPRSPKIGDLVLDDSGAKAKIARFPLYQVGAPNFYDITTDGDKEVKICGWDGTAWHSTVKLISDEDHGDHGGPGSLPKAGSIPVSSTDCPIKKGCEGQPASGPRTNRRNLGRRHDGVRGHTKAERFGPIKTELSTVEAGPNPARSNFISANRAGFEEAKLSERTKAKVHVTPQLAPHVGRLHEQLEAARLNYQGTPSERNLDAYHAAILAVDAGDPLFYLGRYNTLVPQPRPILPQIDYAGISSRMTFKEDGLVDQLRAIAATADTEVQGAICRVCGCTDDDCSGCIRRTGMSCYRVEPDLCSACAPEPATNGKDANE